jgi:hypothetical protein
MVNQEILKMFHPADRRQTKVSRLGQRASSCGRDTVDNLGLRGNAANLQAKAWLEGCVPLIGFMELP